MSTVLLETWYTTFFGPLITSKGMLADKTKFGTFLNFTIPVKVS